MVLLLPDLNPLCYFVKSFVEVNVSATSHKSKNSLKAAFEREWSKSDVNLSRPTEVLVEARHRACTDPEAGIFEQHLHMVMVNACAKQVVNTVTQYLTSLKKEVTKLSDPYLTATLYAEFSSVGKRRGVDRNNR
ncbi:hypothetical protein Y032_0636g933 [Ancylostoma ceylanicum]|uniref:Uncharacterized protein n=1 Tax=Ancylostoma ceylanicum TaxID=53326 RepID=A0A016WJX9_9BILA|nr:hypothetical protein Y032_0636g933 [Ancylostoma ceylanicum]